MFLKLWPFCCSKTSHASLLPRLVKTESQFVSPDFCPHFQHSGSLIYTTMPCPTYPILSCVSVCVWRTYVYMDICAHVYMEVRGQSQMMYLTCYSPWVLFGWLIGVCIVFETRSLMGIWGLRSRLGLLSSEPQESTCLCLPSSGITSTLPRP